MAPGTLSRFVDRLAALEVGTTRVEPSAATAVIDDLVEQPAIGIPLPFSDVDLPASVTSEPTAADLQTATTGVTAGSLGIADYGSVLLTMDSDGSELVSLFNRLHVIVLDAADVVPNIAEALRWIGPRTRQSDTSVIVATGPSATADMGALVKGAHGPERVHVVILEESGETEPEPNGGTTAVDPAMSAEMEPNADADTDADTDTKADADAETKTEGHHG